MEWTSMKADEFDGFDGFDGFQFGLTLSRKRIITDNHPCFRFRFRFRAYGRSIDPRGDTVSPRRRERLRRSDRTVAGLTMAGGEQSYLAG